MKDRDETKYTVWWNSSDGQTSLFGGNFETYEEAKADIPSIEKEFRSQCNEDSPFDEDSTWRIEGPKMTQQDFDDHLALVIEADYGEKASGLLAIPGIYEVLSEHFNNEAIESWEKLQESYHEEDN